MPKAELPHVYLPTVYCNNCGLALVNFYSPENKTWLVAHAEFVHVREKMYKDRICDDAPKVYRVASFELEELT